MTGLMRGRTSLGGNENAPADLPARIVRVDPTDGADGVFRDALIVVSFSHPLDAASLAGNALRVQEGSRTLVGEWKLSPDGAVAIWSASDLLKPGAVHFVVASGLKDCRGRELPRHESRFVPADLTCEDLLT